MVSTLCWRTPRGGLLFIFTSNYCMENVQINMYVFPAVYQWHKYLGCTIWSIFTIIDIFWIYGVRGNVDGHFGRPGFRKSWSSAHFRNGRAHTMVITQYGSTWYRHCWNNLCLIYKYHKKLQLAAPCCQASPHSGPTVPGERTGQPVRRRWLSP